MSINSESSLKMGHGLNLGLSMCVLHSPRRLKLGECKYTSNRFAKY